MAIAMKKAWREILVLLLFALPYFYFSWPTALSPHDSLVWGVFVPGHLWNFETAVENLLEHQRVILTTHDLYYPHGGSLTFIAWSFILLLSFFRLLGIKLIFGLNSAIFLHFLLACYAAYRLALRLVPSRTAAFIAGLAFGYSPFILSIYWNGQLGKLSHGFLPLLILLLIELAETRKRWPIILFGPTFALLLASSPYFGIYAAILTVLISLYFLWRASREMRLALFRRLAVAGVVTAVFASLFLYYWSVSFKVEGYDQLLQPATYQLPPYDRECRENATLSGWLRPYSYRPSLSGRPSIYATHYLGWGVFLLALAAFLPRRKDATSADNEAPLSRGFLLAILIVFVLVAAGYSLRITLERELVFGHRIFLPPYWLAYAFGGRFSFGGMFYRAAVVATLSVALLSAMGWRRLEVYLPKAARPIVAGLVGLVLLSETVFALPITFPLPVRRVEIPQVYRDLAEMKDGGAVLDVPYDSFNNQNHMQNSEYIYPQKIHRHPILLNELRLMNYQQLFRFGDELDLVMKTGILPEPLEPGSYWLGFRYLVLHERPIERWREVCEYLDANLDLLREYPQDRIRLYRAPSLPAGVDPQHDRLDRRYYWSPKRLKYDKIYKGRTGLGNEFFVGDSK